MIFFIKSLFMLFMLGMPYLLINLAYGVRSLILYAIILGVIIGLIPLAKIDLDALLIFSGFLYLFYFLGIIAKAFSLFLESCNYPKKLQTKINVVVGITIFTAVFLILILSFKNRELALVVGAFGSLFGWFFKIAIPFIIIAIPFVIPQFAKNKKSLIFISVALALVLLALFLDASYEMNNADYGNGLSQIFPFLIVSVMILSGVLGIVTRAVILLVKSRLQKNKHISK